MRTLLALTAFLLLAFSCAAQDPGMLAAQQAADAAQQAMQASQQAAQQAMDANLQASRDAQQAMQNAMDAANNSSSGPVYGVASRPKFSLKPGSYNSTTTVRITDSTRGAIIYYTTDGWTPTATSQRYMGPITISSTTNLQAIAIAPNLARSFVSSANYVVNSPAPSPAPPAPRQAPPASIPPDDKLLLPQGTPVPLIFAAPVNSRTAAVGDQIPMTVSQDIQVAGIVLVPKGTPAVATIIQVDKSGAGGLPGVIDFRAESLDLNGNLIRLSGSANREGEAKLPNATVLIPVVGPFIAFKHGADAVIQPGATFIASLYSDTPLSPAK